MTDPSISTFADISVQNRIWLNRPATVFLHNNEASRHQIASATPLAAGFNTIDATAGLTQQGSQTQHEQSPAPRAFENRESVVLEVSRED